MDKADRIATYDSGSTHAMTLSAVDLDKNAVHRYPLAEMDIERRRQRRQNVGGVIFRFKDW